MRKKRYLFILVFLLIVLLRGVIFRACVRYACMEEVPVALIHSSELKALLQQEAAELQSDEFSSWARLSQHFTAEHLYFTDLAPTSKPYGVWATGQAHCVGYAALMGAALKEIITFKQDHSSLGCVPEVVQCRGDIYLFGIRLTGPGRPAFFRDHDYIEVRYPCQEQVVAYDPSLYDYLRIRWVGRK